MEKQGQCGVYKLFKLGKGIGNTFTDEFKKLERDLHVVNHEYAETVNAYSTINGLQYEFDEKASKLYWDKKPYKKVVEFTDFVEVKDDMNVLVKSNDVLDALKEEYLTLAGKKVHHLWKEEKITEEIEKLKK